MRSYIVDLWLIGADRATDCLPMEFATMAEARKAGADWLAESKAERDSGAAQSWDWCDRFTIRQSA